MNTFESDLGAFANGAWAASSAIWTGGRWVLTIGCQQTRIMPSRVVSFWKLMALTSLGTPPVPTHMAAHAGTSWEVNGDHPTPRVTHLPNRTSPTPPGGGVPTTAGRNVVPFLVGITRPRTGSAPWYISVRFLSVVGASAALGKPRDVPCRR